MDSTIELVQLWAAFQEEYPGSSVEDFCRHHLATGKARQDAAKVMAGLKTPIHVDGLLFRLISRISKIHLSLIKVALQPMGLTQMEEFGLLLFLSQAKDTRKSEVIFANLLELSSGTDMVNRLVDRGLVAEVDDKEDKRSKRLRLTPKGLSLVKESMKPIGTLANKLASVLSTEDKEIMVQLLHQIESRFAPMVPVAKGTTFDEVLKDVQVAIKK